LLKAVAYPNSILTDASGSDELGLMKDVDPDQAWGISAGVKAGATIDTIESLSTLIWSELAPDSS
jgi:hypothetical protein